MKSSRNPITLSLVTLACGALFLFPSVASAWVDPSALAQRVVMIAQNVRSLVLGNAAYLKEYVLDTVQKGIATNIEDRILSSTLNWARSGFNGQPSFVVNPREFALGAAENEAELFIDQINNSITRVCAPFRINVTRAVADARLNKGDSSRHDPNDTVRLTQCNVDLLVTNGEIARYYAPGGFEQEGGLMPLFQSFANGADNPYAIEDVVEELLDARQEKAILEAKSKISGGSLPNEQCVVPGPNGSCARSITRTPASNVSDLVSKAVGHSLDEISGQDEILESIFAGVVRRFTDQVITAGGGIR